MSLIVTCPVGPPESYPLHNSKSEFRACPCRLESGLPIKEVSYFGGLILKLSVLFAVFPNRPFSFF